MKKSAILTTATLFALIASSPMLLAGKNSNTSYATTQQALSFEESSDILFMREEEKLARDVYITLYEKWKNPVFTNISRAEVRHMGSMLKLVNNYGLTDPITDDSVGVFVNVELQQLYDTLVAKGLQTELDALYVGALIEEVDMEDIQTAIDRTAQPDITRIYENLMRGSRNHLRAFAGQIERQGIAYEAQQISQEEVDLILSEPVERGGSSNRGQGRRR
jgi:hypothetical protein